MVKRLCLVLFLVAFALPANAFAAPVLFSAAGATAGDILTTVNDFRAALGSPNNANTAGPLASGRREINWDGGGTANTIGGNPFEGFENIRGAEFTTPAPGTGFLQAPPSGGVDNGLAGFFSNPSYGTIFTTFSAARLFTPVGSNITDTFFFLPGSNGNTPATVSGFGAVFTDVDQPDGSGPGEKHGNRGASTLMEFFGVNGELLFSSYVPAAPGDGNLSFFGIKFNDARIARVRIITGNTAPGPDDDGKNDIVMMDDFIYGEPRAIQ